MTRTVDEFLGGYKPPRITVTITQRADLLARLTALSNRYDQARSTSDALNGDEATALLGEIEAVAAEIADSSFDFEFEAISRRDYQQLLDRHAPSDTDRENGLIFNGETFPPALVARCAVEPRVTPAQAAQLMDNLSDSQFQKLWSAAAAVNIGDDTAPKFVRPSGPVDEPATSSDTPLNTPSPEASSSDE